jgi:hypothetical protein
LKIRLIASRNTQCNITFWPPLEFHNLSFQYYFHRKHKFRFRRHNLDTNELRVLRKKSLTFWAPDSICNSLPLPYEGFNGTGDVFWLWISMLILLPARPGTGEIKTAINPDKFRDFPQMAC